MINNRQAGRRRGRGSNNNGGGNGGGGNPRQGGGQGRDTGNRIDSRARGNAVQLHEKYKNLARDAQQSGDRVNIEYYLQFADHYFRVLSEQRSRFEDNQPRRQQSNDAFDDGYDEGDDDYGAEGEPIRSGEQAGADRDERNDGQRNDGQRNDGGNRGYQGNGDQNRSDGPRRDYARQDSAREDSQRYDGQRPDNSRQDAQRQDTQRADQQRGNANAHANDRRPREDRDGGNQGQRAEIQGQPRADRQPRVDRQRSQPRVEEIAPVEVSTVDASPVEEAPRRRGRPRRDAASVTGDAPGTVEADRLPPSLSIAPVASNDVAEDAPKPRRRRTPRTDSPEVTAAE